MDRNALKVFITDFYQAWKDRDAAKVPTFYDKNVRAYSDFKEVTLEDMLSRLEFSREQFLETNYNIQDLFIDETQGKIAIRMKQNHPLRDGTGNATCEAIMLYKVFNHKITEIWMSFYPNVDYLNNSKVAFQNGSAD